MAIHGAQRHLVVFGDVARALPMNKFLFDFVAKVVGADGTVGFVSQSCNVGGWASRLASGAPTPRSALRFSLIGRNDGGKAQLFKRSIEAGQGFQGQLFFRRGVAWNVAG